MKPLFTLISILFIYNSTLGQNNNDAILEKKLDSVFAKTFSKDEPGGSIFIQQGDKILYQKSFGLSDLKTKKEFTNKTISNIGSISKTFVAYAY